MPEQSPLPMTENTGKETEEEVDSEGPTADAHKSPTQTLHGPTEITTDKQAHSQQQETTLRESRISTEIMETETSRPLPEKPKLRPEDCYSTEKEKALNEKRVVSIQPLRVGTIPDKKILHFEDGTSALYKSFASEFEPDNKGDTKIYRRTVEPGTYFIRERIAAILDKLFEFNQVPTTIIKEKKDEPAGRDIGSLQEWVDGKKMLEEVGGWDALIQWKHLEKVVQQEGEDTLEPEQKQMYEYYQNLKPKLLTKAVADLLKLHGDICSHGLNVLVNGEVNSIDNGFTLCHPAEIVEDIQQRDVSREISMLGVAPDFSSLLTKIFHDEALPEELMQKLEGIKEKLETGAIQERIDPLKAELNLRFDYYKYLYLAVNKLLEEKKVLTARDLRAMDEFQEFFNMRRGLPKFSV